MSGVLHGAVAVAVALLTRPERTAFNETSTYADVVAFMEAAAKAAPKLIHLTTFGTSSEGRSLPLAVVGAADASPEAVRRTGKLRVYIQGNIHAGEVEGKESAQMLLRELAEGKHADWLQLDGAARRADLQRRRQREDLPDQPRPSARADGRAGAAAERAGLRPEPRPHEARLAGSARVREADERLRSAGVDGPAHHERDPSRLSPDLRAAAQSGDRPRHHRSPAQGLAAVGDQDHQDQVRLGLLLLRQRRGARRRRHAGRTRVEVVRFTAALQQQLHRPSQPHRHPQRGVLVRHLRGPHQGDEPVRRRDPRLRARACGEDPDAHRGGRQQEAARRQPAGAAGGARARARAWSRS